MAPLLGVFERKRKKKQAQSSLFIIVRFSYHDLSCTFQHACSFLFLRLPFVLPWLFFTPFCFDAHFWSGSICAFLAFIPFSLFLALSPLFLFPLVLRPLAFTGGYSSLGWAETASLYNTDRLLCNQIPSVATSEESLPRFLHHTHTHACRHTCTQARTHTCTLTTSVPPTPQRVCSVYVQ